MAYRVVFFNISDFTQKSRFPSLGLAYLASYLRKYSGDFDLSIIEGGGLPRLKALKPDLVGIYSVTQEFSRASAAAEAIKKECGNIPVIIGGYHITALPYTLPEVFDVAVLGEGEETMRELTQEIASNGIDPQRLSLIKGIAFHGSGAQGVVVTPARGYVENIDSIPFPARDLLINMPFTSIITSRGCPYKCIFCSSVKFWGKPRFHSPEYVADEMELLVRKFHAAHISIWDDLFIANRPRLDAIRSLIRKRKINKKVTFGCALRSNLVTPELCSLLKDINVRRASIGFESGSQRILDMLKCGSVSVEQHIRAVELLKSCGIFTTGTFMIGSPGEDRDDMLRTLGLIGRLKLTGGGNISLAAPLPGTGLWEYAKDNGLLDERIEPSKIGLMSTDFTDPQHFKGVLLTDKISKEEFFELAQKMQRETNRHYIRGLFWRGNFSFRVVKFFISRPVEALKILKFLLKSLLHKAGVMERYAFYYKKAA